MDDPILRRAERLALVRRDFATFVKLVFKELNPRTPLVWDPYLDVVCANLGAVVLGGTRRMALALPPRHLKSECGTIALSAFFLGHFPDKTVMAVSYGRDLALTLARKTRKVMQSAWYKEAFPTRLENPRGAVDMMRTVQGGLRQATSIEGAATGFGSDLMIFDDPQKAADVASEALRTSANNAFAETFLSRQNSPDDFRVVIIQQRLHEDDFLGHVTKKGKNWSILSLSAIAEQDEEHRYSNWAGEEMVWRRQPEDLLHPGRFSSDKLEEFRLDVGEAVWAAQYQQRPAPAGGGIVKIGWFLTYKDRPVRCDRVVQSWDTASKTGLRNDFSVCVTFGQVGDQIFVLDVYRERLEYHDLKAKVVSMQAAFRADVVVIEDAGVGTALLQELTKAQFFQTHPVKPHRSKQVRMEGLTGHLAAGKVLVPEQAVWVPDFLYEAEVFPNGRFDDQVDAFSQGLEYLQYFTVPHSGLLEWYRREAEALNNPPQEAQEELVPFRSDNSSTFYTQQSKRIRPDRHGIFWIPESSTRNCIPFRGWHRVSEEELEQLGASPPMAA